MMIGFATPKELSGGIDDMSDSGMMYLSSGEALREEKSDASSW